MRFWLCLITGMICSMSGRAQFTQQGNKLLGYDVSLAPNLGRSVALSADGNTAIAGGPVDGMYGRGAAWVFTRSGLIWTQQGPKLVPNDGSGFGSSVALSSDGNTAVIGGLRDNRSGACWIFTRNGPDWSQQGSKLVPNDPSGNPWFGSSVALSADGNTAIIAGVRDNNFAGAVWVFTRTGSAWSQQGAKLVPGDSAANLQFGSSVALSADGNTAIIGGAGDNSFAGAVWIFTRTGSAWSQQGSKLVPTDAAGNPAFGSAVAISTDGNTVLIGGPSDNGGVGAAWAFVRDGAAWVQQGYKLATASVTQGAAVALSGDGNTAVIGAPGDGLCDGFLETCVGATWVFRRINGVWTQQDKLLGTGQAGLLPAQGSAVAISADGSTAFVGGPEGQQFEYVGGYFVGAAWAYALPHLTVTAPSATASGMQFEFVISAQDANGLLLPNYAGFLHSTSSDSAAVLPPDTTVWGLANLSATLMTPGLQTLKIMDAANSGIFGSVTICVAGVNGPC